jgi:hypothetical protein
MALHFTASARDAGKPVGLPYRLAIRDASAADITAWLDQNLAPQEWRVERLAVGDSDDPGGAVRYVVRFRRQDDMLRFKQIWVSPRCSSKPASAPTEVTPPRGIKALLHGILHP